MWKSTLILFLFLFIGCSSEDGYQKASFQDNRTAVVQIIGNPIEVGIPMDMCFVGDYICVLAYTQNCWLHIYDKESGNLVYESIKNGKGPGEGVNFSTMDFRKDEHNLYIYDVVLQKTVIYHLDEISGRPQYLREIDHSMVGVIRKCHVLPDGNFIYEGYFAGQDKDTRLTLSNIDSPLDAYSEYPGIHNEDDKLAFILGVSCADSNVGRYVCGTMFGAVLECFELRNNKIERTALRLIDPPKMDLSGPVIKAVDGKKYGFFTFCIDGDVIFANYMDTLDANDFNDIVSFDWNGHEKIKYSANQNILRMCPGEKSGEELFCIVSSPEREFSLAKLTLK